MGHVIRGPLPSFSSVIRNPSIPGGSRPEVISIPVFTDLLPHVCARRNSCGVRLVAQRRFLRNMFCIRNARPAVHGNVMEYPERKNFSREPHRLSRFASGHALAQNDLFERAPTSGRHRHSASTSLPGFIFATPADTLRALSTINSIYRSVKNFSFVRVRSVSD